MKNSIEQQNFNGEKVLVRVDFNVPLNDQFQITDDSRMRAAVPTIEKIINDGGSVIIMSHLGRPKEGPTEKYSLKHIVAHLSTLLNKDVKFAADCIGNEAVELAAGLQAGDVVMTGTCVVPVPVKPGDAVVADFGDFGSVKAQFN